MRAATGTARRPRRRTTRARPRRVRTIDPITVEIVRGAMETIACEMATHVSLTATTPIERTERAYRKALSTLRAEEEQRYQEKDRALAALMQKLKVTVGRTLIASACFRAI